MNSSIEDICLAAKSPQDLTSKKAYKWNRINSFIGGKRMKNLRILNFEDNAIKASKIARVAKSIVFALQK